MSSDAVQHVLANLSAADKLELMIALQAQLGQTGAGAAPASAAAAAAASSPIPAAQPSHSHSHSHSKRSSGSRTPLQLDSPAAIKSAGASTGGAGSFDPAAHDSDPLSPLSGGGGLTDSLQRQPSSLTSSFNAHAHSYASSPTGGNSLTNSLTHTAKSLTSTCSSTFTSHTPGQHPGLLNSNSSLMEIRRTGSRFSSLGSEGRGGGSASVGAGSGNLQARGGRFSSGGRHARSEQDETPEQTDEEEQEPDQAALSEADVHCDMSASLSRRERDRTLTPRSAARMFPPPSLSTPAESKEEQEARSPSSMYSSTTTADSLSSALAAVKLEVQQFSPRSSSAASAGDRRPSHASSRSGSANESLATTVHAQAPGGPSIGPSSHDAPATSRHSHSHSHSHSGSGTPNSSTSRRSSATPSPAPHTAASAAAASTALYAHSSRRSSVGGAIPPVAAAASASDYTLGEVLGQGLFGKVYRATEKASGVEVAVKVFVFDAAAMVPASSAGGSSSSPHSGSSTSRRSHSRSGSGNRDDDNHGPIDAREAVRREVVSWSHMVAAQASPNLLPLYAALPYGSQQLWVVSQLQELGSFSDILARRKKQGLVAVPPAAPRFMPDRLVGAVLRQALMGLQQLYACYPAGSAAAAASSSAGSAAAAAALPGHGSVKCSALLLSASGQVRLADRAAAQRLDATFKPQGMQSVYYMSPEAIAEPSSAPRPRDVWGLGILAIELADGLTPHAGVNPLKVCGLIPRGPAPTLRAAVTAGSSPSLLADFISRCCVKLPSARWSVAQLLSHPLIEAAAEVSPAELVEFARAGMP